VFLFSLYVIIDLEGVYMEDLSKKVERKDEMDEFLIFFQELYKNNPTLQVKQSYFYNGLQTYKTSSDYLIDFRNKPTIDTDYLNYFIEWQKHFKDNPNIDVYHDVRQLRFLQFNNTNYIDPGYKLYLTFPKDKVEECVEIIFDYIASKNMKTISKVSDCLRADSIVLRMVEKEEAIDLINFINSNSVLSESAGKTNPFIQREGVVAVAYDDWLSYNGMFAYMLEKYFSFKVTSSSLDYVSLGDFRAFIYKFYKDVMFDKDNLNSFLEDDYIKSELVDSPHISKGKFLSNIKDIFELMSLELDPAVDIDHYFGMVDEFLKPQHYAANLKYFTKLLGEELDVNNNANHDAEAYLIFDKACSKILNEHDMDYLVMALNEALKGNFEYFDIGYIDRGKFDIYAIEMLERYRDEKDNFEHKKTS